jgi:hypothetical protein
LAAHEKDNVVGTYGILRTLRHHWTSPTHPVYRLEDRRIVTAPTMQAVRRSLSRTWRPLAAAGAVVALIVLADFLCSGTRRGSPSLSTAIISMCSVVVVGIFLLGLLVLTYLWPLAVAQAASRVIAGEHERQTWDVLLTTPFDRAELLLVKLASALRSFNPYAEMLLWMQTFLIAIIFVLLAGHFAQQPGATALEGTLTLLLLILTMAEFAVARLQDYALSSLLGLFTSLLAPTRQTASATALLLASAWVLIRALFTALFLFGLPPVTPAELSILMATGPSSVVTMALPIPVAGLVLLIMPLLREAAIRVLFRWLVNHLGQAPSPII